MGFGFGLDFDFGLTLFVALVSGWAAVAEILGPACDSAASAPDASAGATKTQVTAIAATTTARRTAPRLRMVPLPPVRRYGTADRRATVDDPA